MNDRFKFNAYDKTLDIMHKNIQNADNFKDYLENKNYILLQHTGWFDKNNTPIVEGDILKYSFVADGEEDYGVFPIIFEDLCFCWQYGISDDNTRPIHNEQFDKNAYEVIGNIYQNKDILQKEGWKIK